MNKKYLALSWLQIFFCVTSFANYKPVIIADYNEQYYREIIDELYHNYIPLSRSSRRLSAGSRIHKTLRVKKISQFFLGKPYILGALGEGRTGKFDKSPFYRTDAFDCATFVSTVLALSLANNVNEFEEKLADIQYQDGILLYTKRFHFLELDWNRHNQRAGYIKDITSSLCTNCRLSTVMINKPAWFQKADFNRIKLLHPISAASAKQLLHELQSHAATESPQLSKIVYIPLTELFVVNKQGELIAKPQLFEKIPSCSIVEIIDKNKNFNSQIGTDLSVVHLGFAIRQHHQLYLRHASRSHCEVVDVPLIQYLHRYYEYTKHPQLVGINVERIL